MKDQFKKPYVRKTKARTTGLTKIQKVQVKALVAAPVETKYVADIPQVYGGAFGPVPAFAFGVLQTIISGGPSYTAWNLMPDLTQGTQGNDRVGNKISNVTLKSSWQFWINPDISGNPTVDATVKVFILKSRTAKTFEALEAVPAGSLLDTGLGQCIDWQPGTAIDAKYLDTHPVNKEQFTVLKIHKFRICKNQESPTAGIGSAAAPNMTSHQTKDFTHTLKHKGSVVYPDFNLGGSLQPNNLTYFAYVVVYDTNTRAGLPDNTVICNVRSHMYYKDM